MGILSVERFLRKCHAVDCPHRRRSLRAWLDPVRGFTLDRQWYCSPECFEKALVSEIIGLLSGPTHQTAKSHRVPLGLLMLDRGLVDNDQLKKALKAQKESGTGRVGEWLRHLGAVNEEQVTQILGVQWSIPVFPLNQSRKYLECAGLLPLGLLEEAEMLPVHHLPSSQHLYVAFVDRVNRSALYAVEKILACRTEPCLVAQSQMHKALRDLRSLARSLDVAVQTIDDPWEMASTISSEVERLDAQDTRISGFDGFIWARVLAASDHSDVIFRARKAPPDFPATGEIPEGPLV